MSKSTLYVIIFFCCGILSAQENFKPIIQDYLQKNVKNISIDDVSDIEIYNTTYSKKTGLHHVYVNQRKNGIPVFNAIGNFAIKNEKVVYFSNNLIHNLEEKTNASTPTLSPLQSVQSAAEKLGLNFSGLEIIQSNGNKFIISKGNLSLKDIPAQLVYQEIENELILAWDISIYLTNENHWWSMRIDANTGEILHQNDWVVNCTFEDNHSAKTTSHHFKNNSTENFGFKNSSTNSTSTLIDGSSYNVFPLPIEAPTFGDRSIVTEPANLNASPFGWHDTNGVAGAEFTTTRGNNVWAYENRDGNNFFGPSPDGGTNLNFDFPLDLNQNPEGYIEASVTNLFYWNNMMHDVWYEYGFDEQSGNFQSNNYVNGVGGDYVVARNQDGADNGPGNNATFGTPPEGQNPTMRMFTWSPSGLPQVLIVNSPSSLAGSYSGTVAQFGPAFPEGGVTGDLALVTDNNATTTDENDACDPTTNSSEINGKIAVIRRGECTFVSKVQAAQNSGAIAVIIVNNVPDELITMNGDNAGSINIPSIFMTLEEGNLLIAALENNQSVNGTVNLFGPFEKDGSLDGGIISHEYGHGISNRLTGGALNSNCLYSCQQVDSEGNCIQYTEQMGEGWSDYFALMMTLSAADNATDAKAVATYALSQDPDGNGLRNAPYSTDFNVNDFTYNDTNNTFQVSAPHGVGFVWATMLWDMTWALIDEHGYDADILNGEGGNNMAMQLVIDGIKLQNCNPGFVDGRDAILEADMINNNGENQCLIWQAFANRGLGYGASQGSSLSRTDQTEAFDMPPENILNCSLKTSSKEVKNFSIYPNPAGDVVNIETKQNTNNLNVQVFDINGRKVIQKDISTKTLDVSQLSGGIYLLKINSNGVSQTEKLIIQ